jgi:hypothetical protein
MSALGSANSDDPLSRASEERAVGAGCQLA